MNLWPTLSCLFLFVRHVATFSISHAKRQRRGQLLEFSEHVFAFTTRIDAKDIPKPFPTNRSHVAIEVRNDLSIDPNLIYMSDLPHPKGASGPTKSIPLWYTEAGKP